jgi:hypothetical protein
MSVKRRGNKRRTISTFWPEPFFLARWKDRRKSITSGWFELVSGGSLRMASSGSRSAGSEVLEDTKALGGWG